MLKSIKTCFGIVACIILVTEITAACTCLKVSAGEMFQQADAVFLGKVVSIESSGRCPSMVRVGFEVERSWKLVNTTEIPVITDYSASRECAGMCGVSFRQGDSYMVYARMTGRGLYTNICAGTVDLADAGEQLSDVKGRPTVPLRKKSGGSKDTKGEEKSGGGTGVAREQAYGRLRLCLQGEHP